MLVYNSCSLENLGKWWLRFMWWQLVIDYLHKSFDNSHSLEIAFK